jgi:hypothetical protein
MRVVMWPETGADQKLDGLKPRRETRWLEAASGNSMAGSRVGKLDGWKPRRETRWLEAASGILSPPSRQLFLATRNSMALL